jgi:hypothetical protein
MRRELEELAGDGRSFDAPSRVITVVGSIGETIDPDGERRERERLIAEARARYPGNRELLRSLHGPDQVGSPPR